MTERNHLSAPVRGSSIALMRYLSCLRLKEILVLQGSPILGFLLSTRNLAGEHAAPLAILIAANLCLVAHVFLLNDWFGIDADLVDPNKAAGVFTARDVSRGEMAGLTFLFLALSLVLFGLLGSISTILALAIVLLSALYSMPWFDWKGRPILSSAAHLGGGTIHYFLGCSAAGDILVRDVAIAAFFALTFAAGHLTQELRDYAGDATCSIKTNAVAFGVQRAFTASIVLFTLAHLIVFLLALDGVLPRTLTALVILYPVHLIWSFRAWAEGLTRVSIIRLQARYRALYAMIGLAMVCALIFDARS